MVLTARQTSWDHRHLHAPNASTGASTAFQRIQCTDNARDRALNTRRNDQKASQTWVVSIRWCLAPGWGGRARNSSRLRMMQASTWQAHSPPDPSPSPRPQLSVSFEEGVGHLTCHVMSFGRILSDQRKVVGHTDVREAIRVDHVRVGADVGKLNAATMPAPCLCH